MFGWSENRGMENRVENDILYCLVQERKQERRKMGRKIFPTGSHFFILSIWEENGEEKVLNDIFYTNTLTLFISHMNDYYYFFPLFPRVLHIARIANSCLLCHSIFIFIFILFYY